MSSFLISISISLLLLVGPCSHGSPTVPKGPWSLDYKTSGGFVGVGKGSIIVNSEGKFACSSNNRGEVVKGATGTLTPKQLQTVSGAVAQLNPKGWNVPGLNVAAPDAFGYKLEFRAANDVTPVQWYDNTVDKLPADLKHLSAALDDTMKARCTVTSKE